MIYIYIWEKSPQKNICCYDPSRAEELIVYIIIHFFLVYFFVVQCKIWYGIQLYAYVPFS